MTSHLAMFAASRLVHLSPTDVVIIVFYFVLVLNLVLYRCFSFGQRQSDCAGGYPGAPQSAGAAGCLFTCTPTSGGEDFSCWSGCFTASGSLRGGSARSRPAFHLRIGALALCISTHPH